MRISDWSSDVCSSDLVAGAAVPGVFAGRHSARVCTLPARAGMPGGRGPGPVRPAPGVRRMGAALGAAHPSLRRHSSGERRGGEEVVSTGRTRWAPYNSKKKIHKIFKDTYT